MADIEKISVGGTSYDVRDALAAHALSDIAVAGDNVTFEPLPYKDITITGSVILNDGIASNFTESNYIDFKDSTRYTTGTTTYYLKVKTPSSGSIQGAILQWNRWANLEFWSDAGLNAWNWGSDSSVNLLADSQVQSDTEYYFKIDVDYENKTKTYSYSLDGTAYTQLASFTDTGMNTSYSNPLRLGNSSYSPSSGNAFTGSIDLGGCCIERSGVEIARGYYANAKTSINTTVDQTYNASSTNAQSGVAIDGAGFLRNLSTGTNAVDVNYAGTANNSVTMGANTTSASSAITFGSSAKGNPYGVSIGRSAGTAGAAGNNSIAIGNNSSSSQYTGGCTAGTNSTALGSMTFARGNNSVAVGGATAMFQAAQAAGEGCVSIGFMALSGADSTTNSVDPTYTPTVGDVAIGGGAIASGGHAIQIGQGTNTTAQTLSVGFGNDTSSNPLNYQLLDSTGTIPSARMPSDVLKNTATGSNSICILGNASGDANGSRSVAIGTDSYASQNNCVAIGNYAAATGYTSVAVGMCQATANYAIQLGTGKNVDANTFSVGLSNSLNVRLLNSDGTIPGERMALQGTEAPTTATVGSVGQFYVDTTNQIGYMCVSAADSTYVWKQITA